MYCYPTFLTYNIFGVEDSIMQINFVSLLFYIGLLFINRMLKFYTWKLKITNYYI